MQRVVKSETPRSEQTFTLYTEEEIQCVTTTSELTQNSIVNKSERNLPEVTSTSEETEKPSSSIQRACMDLYEEGVVDSATIDSAFDVKDGFHDFGKVSSVSADRKLLCSDSKEGSEKVLSFSIGYDDSDNGTEADVFNTPKEIKGELSGDKRIEDELSKLFDSGTVGVVEDTKQTVNIVSDVSATQTVPDKTETSVATKNIDNQDTPTIKGNKREEGQISNSDSGHSWSSSEEKKDSKKHKEQKKEKHHRKKTKEKKKKRKKRRKLKNHEGSIEPESGNENEEKLSKRNRSSSPESRVRNKWHKRSRSRSRDWSSRHQCLSRSRSPNKERRKQMSRKSKDRKSRSTSRSQLSSTKHSSSKKESDLKTFSPRGKSSNKSVSSATKRDEQSKRTFSEKDQSMSDKRKLSRSSTPPRRLSSDSKRRRSSSDRKYSLQHSHSRSRRKSSGDRNRRNSPSLSRSLDRSSQSPLRRKSSRYGKSRRSESPPVRRKLSSSGKKSKSTSKSPYRQSQSPKRRKSSPRHKSLASQALSPGRKDETTERKQRKSPPTRISPVRHSQLPSKQKASPLYKSSKSHSHSPVRRNSKKRKCSSTSKSPVRNSPSPKPSPGKDKLIAHKKHKQSSSSSKSPTETSHSLKKRKDSKGSSSPVESPVHHKDMRNFVVSWHTMSESDIEMSDGKSPSRKSPVTEKVIINTSTSRSPLKSEESGKHESPLSSPSKLLDDEFDYVFTERLISTQGSEKSVEDVLFGQDPLATDPKPSSEKWSTSTAEVKGSTIQDKPVDQHQTSFCSNSQVSNEKVEKHTENGKFKEFMENPTEVNQLQQTTENQEEMKVETTANNAFDEKSSDPSIKEEKSEVTSIPDNAGKINNSSSEGVSVAGAVESPMQESSSVQAADFEQNDKSPTGVKSESETEGKESDFVVSKFDTIPFLDGTPPAPQTPVSQLGTPAAGMGILPTPPVNQTWQGHSEGSNYQGLLIPSPPPVLRVAGHNISQGTDLTSDLGALGMLGHDIPPSPGSHADDLRESNVLIRNDINPGEEHESKLLVSTKNEGRKNFESSPMDMEMSSPEGDIIDKLNEEFWKQQQQQQQQPEKERHREDDQIREAFVEYGTTGLLPDEEPYEPEIGLLSDDMEEEDDLDNVADPKERKKRKKAKQLEKTKVQTLIDKLHRQARVEEEVKHVLKVYYKHRDIDKEEYKNILRRAVPQVTNSSSAIDPERIRSLVKKYVAKVKGQRILAV